MAHAALCQACGKETCESTCPRQIALKIRTAGKKTPFRLGI